jgi:hypothetical protein
MAQTVKVAGKELPLDDSEADVIYADVVTETAVIDGTIYLGLGQLVASANGQGAYVKDVVHIRFNMMMLKRITDQLNRLRDTAIEQATGLRQQAEAELKRIRN